MESLGPQAAQNPHRDLCNGQIVALIRTSSQFTVTFTFVEPVRYRNKYSSLIEDSVDGHHVWHEYEALWRDRQKYLKGKGCMLRPRYRRGVGCFLGLKR